MTVKRNTASRRLLRPLSFPLVSAPPSPRPTSHLPEDQKRQLRRRLEPDLAYLALHILTRQAQVDPSRVDISVSRLPCNASRRPPQLRKLTA